MLPKTFFTLTLTNFSDWRVLGCDAVCSCFTLMMKAPHSREVSGTVTCQHSVTSQETWMIFTPCFWS